MAQGIVKCELCVEDKDGTWFCKNCHQSLCEGCKIIHLRANISKHHEIISRKDMFQTQGESARHMDEYCKTHTKELYILFCKTCECQVCRRCIISQHAQHNLIEIEEVFCEQREKGEKYVRELSQDETTREVFQGLVKKIKDESSKIKAELDIATDSMIEVARDRYQAGEKSKGEKESALSKLNKSLQSNKVSEIMAAVQFCKSIQGISDSDNVTSSELIFVPGTHSVKMAGDLLGSFRELGSPSGKVPLGFTVTHADFDTKTMCLRYNFPEKTRKKYRPHVAQLTGPRSFSTKLKEFSIKIKKEGDGRDIGIGIVPKDYQELSYPGWESQSYGYHADNGGIYVGDGWSPDGLDTCFEGDVMGCRFDVTTRKLTFSKNGKKVRSINVTHKCLYYPMIGLQSSGAEVMLLEREPWFL